MESFSEIQRTMFPGAVKEISETGDLEPCIMIIDDDLDIIETLTAVLKTRYRLTSCRSFEEATTNLWRDLKLVLLDIKMALRDGVEVFKLLKERRPNLRIVFHSAYPGSRERAAAVEQLPHNGYLTKGEYDLRELLTTIEQALI